MHWHAKIGNLARYFFTYHFFSLKNQFQGGHWSGKSQGNLIFLQGQGKLREFCRLVREILNTKKLREKSGNFIILGQNMC